MSIEKSTPLYESLTQDLSKAIQNGVLNPGERLPSIRQTSQSRQLSVSTVLRAYAKLESLGLVEGRPQSGYFVRKAPTFPAATAVPAALAMSIPPATASEVDVSALVLRTLKSIRSENAVRLGSPLLDPELLPTRALMKHLGAVTRRPDVALVGTGLPPGHPDLIRQIARRYLQAGLVVDPAEVVITDGATEAINLCLQAVAKPGDTIAIESPTYYAMLHAIERMGMRAIEIPTHPEEGISLEWLRHTLQQYEVAACMVMPNFQNPLGFKMSNERKQELVRIAEEFRMPIIENGVYDELYYGDTPPTSLKSFDTQGWVLHCSSFSKTLSASFRVGWALTGRFHPAVEKLKFLNTMATPPLQQMALASYLANEGFDHHLRGLRKMLYQNAAIMSSMVKRFFPPGSRVSAPQGGYMLWVELGSQMDSMALYDAASDKGMTIAPGRIFSNSDMYKHFVRLNFGFRWSREKEAAIVELGAMAGGKFKGSSQAEHS